MTIDKAIMVLKHPPFYPNTPSDIEYAKAMKLGIEALWDKNRYSFKQRAFEGKLLPSETDK